MKRKIEKVYVDGKPFTSIALAAASNHGVSVSYLQSMIARHIAGRDFIMCGHTVSYRLAPKEKPVKHEALLRDDDMEDEHGNGTLAWADADAAIYAEITANARTQREVNEALIARVTALEKIITALKKALGEAIA